MRKACLGHCDVRFRNGNEWHPPKGSLVTRPGEIASGTPTAFDAAHQSRELEQAMQSIASQSANAGRRKKSIIPGRAGESLPPLLRSVGLLEEHLTLDGLLVASGTPPAHQAES